MTNIKKVGAEEAAKLLTAHCMSMGVRIRKSYLGTLIIFYVFTIL